MGFMDKVMSKAQDVGKAGQAKVDSVQAKRQMDDLYHQIGELIYSERAGRAADSAPQVEEAITKLQQLESTHPDLFIPPVQYAGGIPVGQPVAGAPGSAGDPAVSSAGAQMPAGSNIFQPVSPLGVVPTAPSGSYIPGADAGAPSLPGAPPMIPTAGAPPPAPMIPTAGAPPMIPTAAAAPMIPTAGVPPAAAQPPPVPEVLPLVSYQCQSCHEYAVAMRPADGSAIELPENCEKCGQKADYQWVCDGPPPAAAPPPAGS